VTSVLFLTLFFVFVAIAHLYRLLSWNELVNRNPGTVRYLLVSVFLFELMVLHLVILFPDYYFPSVSRYLSHFRPVLIWLAFLFAQTFLFLAYYGGISLETFRGWRKQKPVFIALVSVGMVWGLIALTGIGIIPDEAYWNVAGIPILAGQIWTGIGITLLAWFLLEKFVTKKYEPWLSRSIIFIVIWAVAALVWVRTPLGPTFNVPGPYPPSRGFYPFVDAALYDLGAQSAIHGKGLFFGAFMDRGLLSGFLALLHRIFGQNYLVIVGAQSAIFAIFPGLLYLLGEKLHSRSAGIMAATLAVLKVSNAMTGGRLIGTSHPKLMLTEFPTGIVLVLFALFLVRWLRQGNASVFSLAGMGASIGIGILLRHNVLFMLPVMFIMGLVVWRQRRAFVFRDVFIVALAFFITISPWMWRNQRVAGQPFFFLLHFNQVIEERYQPQSNIEQERPALNVPSRSLRVRASITKEVRSDLLDLNQYQFIPKHFVHNVVTSVLILPPSPVLDDFRHVIDLYPYWDRMEGASLGEISISMGIFLAVNLIILSIGIGLAWKRVKFAALVPLLVFLFYNLANAFARTSGGRYIVPVDWVVYFYYAIGLVAILSFSISAMGFRANGFFEQPAPRTAVSENTKSNLIRAGLVVLPFFLLVAMLPAIELASPGEKPAETTESLLQQLDEISFFEESGLPRSEVEGFLENPDSILISGHGLYPRYYSHGQGEPFFPEPISTYMPREFPRLIFMLLLPDSYRTVLLPIDTPRLNFPDAAEVIVGGCQVGRAREDVLTPYVSYIDAAFVVILDETQATYVRIPEAPLACPLRQPVCDNNRNCN
jgi:hypothetical protein